MNTFISFVSAILLLSTAVFAQQCVDPQFSQIKTSGTLDTKINTETAYLAEFRVKCANNVKNVPFFAEVNGNVLLSSSDESGERYQVSWTENHKAARSGEINLRIFDEEGFVALKKAQRNNEDISKVKELTTVSFYYQGAYKGPYLQSELVAVVLFGALFYYAQTARSEIQA